MSNVRKLTIEEVNSLAIHLVDDTESMIDYLSGLTLTTFSLFDWEVWDSYLAFLTDVVEVFEEYDINAEFLDEIFEWQQKIFNIYKECSDNCLMYKKNDEIYFEDFWLDFQSLALSINLQANEIIKRKKARG